MAIKPEQYFWLANGKPVKSLSELSEVLAGMSKEVFNHHVTSEKNDFSNWIKGVFKGKSLADEIESTKTPKEMKEKIDVFLRPKKQEIKKNSPKNIEIPGDKKEIKKAEKLQKKKIKRDSGRKKKIKTNKSSPVKKKNKKNTPIANKVENKEEDSRSIIYQKAFRDKWNSEESENKDKSYYRSLIRYGFMEFVFGIAVGAFIVLVLRGMI